MLSQLCQCFAFVLRGSQCGASAEECRCLGFPTSSAHRAGESGKPPSLNCCPDHAGEVALPPHLNAAWLEMPPYPALNRGSMSCLSIGMVVLRLGSVKLDACIQPLPKPPTVHRTARSAQRGMKLSANCYTHSHCWVPSRLLCSQTGSAWSSVYPGLIQSQW